MIDCGRTWVMTLLCVVMTILLGINGIAGAQECSDQCEDCSSDGRCRHCFDGYYGVNCTPCSPFCKYSACILDLCNNGCIAGRYGYSCDKNCSYCPNTCDQWRGICEQPQLFTKPHRLMKDSYLDMEYQVLIVLLSIAALGILLTVVFVKGTRYRYRQLRCNSRGPRRKNKQTIFVNKALDAPIWKTTPDLGPTQMTSSISMRPTSLPSNIGAESLQEAEKIPLVHSPSDIRIVVSPPSTK